MKENHFKKIVLENNRLPSQLKLHARACGYKYENKCVYICVCKYE